MCCAADNGPILAVLDCMLDGTWAAFRVCMDIYTGVCFARELEENAAWRSLGLKNSF